MSQAASLFVPVPVAEGKPPRRLAVNRTPARGNGAGRPGLVWLGGFRSDMQSGKAQALAAWAAGQGRACVLFDYSGHGQSEGAFTDGTIGAWLADALAVIRAATEGPQILVGSSMGGWLALLAIRALAAAGETDRIAGSVLIAPAVDFTEALMWKRLSADIQATIMREGVWMRPSPYGTAPYPITRELIAEARAHLMLDTRIEAHGPVHILQGMRDEDVPWAHAMTLVEHLAFDPVSITLIKDGDHRLSRPEDIAKLLAAVDELVPAASL